MLRTKVKIKLIKKDELDQEVNLLPSNASAYAAGVDLKAACPREGLVIPGGERAAIPTGLTIEIEGKNIAGFIFSRSGLGARQGLTVAQGVGVVDPDYRGEIIVWLLNTSNEPIAILPGDRIAQLVFLPFYTPIFEITDELSPTSRGAGGFGSSGR